ncbi:MAG: DEAD/DEAH box helicase, partial [Actinomycetia bacterium]|nr:DEAD/DEAH box helicase [Actinomycetes bacterium]
PLSNGAILADEVGLGKTIEAGLIISQKWAENKRKILIIVPSSIRSQWQAELSEKFYLPSVIIESKYFNEKIKKGSANPFKQHIIVIASYHFVRNKAEFIKDIKWDLAVIDEAHRLRNVYKKTNKIARTIKNTLKNVPKILLTATPLHNSLLELYGLVSFIDEYTFGDLNSFKYNFTKLDENNDKWGDLKSRLNLVCKRTLRRQVNEYIKYTNRIPLIQEFTPTRNEMILYDWVSDYLRKKDLYALPSGQRALMTLVMRKLLASSSFAIGGTLTKLINRLEMKMKTPQLRFDFSDIEEDFEHLHEVNDEWDEGNSEHDTSNYSRFKPDEKIDPYILQKEIDELKTCRDLAL